MKGARVTLVTAVQLMKPQAWHAGSRQIREGSADSCRAAGSLPWPADTSQPRALLMGGGAFLCPLVHHQRPRQWQRGPTYCRRQLLANAAIAASRVVAIVPWAASGSHRWGRCVAASAASPPRLHGRDMARWSAVEVAPVALKRLRRGQLALVGPPKAVLFHELPGLVRPKLWSGHRCFPCYECTASPKRPSPVPLLK
jgi:hypothetical protein